MRSRPYRTAFNLLILVLLIGVWHGAGWNYVLFGLFHGLCLVVYHLLCTRPGRKRRGPLLGNWLVVRPDRHHHLDGLYQPVGGYFTGRGYG